MFKLARHLINNGSSVQWVLAEGSREAFAQQNTHTCLAQLLSCVLQMQGCAHLAAPGSGEAGRVTAAGALQVTPGVSALSGTAAWPRGSYRDTPGDIGVINSMGHFLKMGVFAPCFTLLQPHSPARALVLPNPGEWHLHVFCRTTWDGHVSQHRPGEVLVFHRITESQTALDQKGS